MKLRILKIIYVILILIGLLLPLGVRVYCEFLFEQKDLIYALKNLPSLLIAPGKNLLFVALLNDIPFIALALVSKYITKYLIIRKQIFYYHNLTGLISAGLALIVFSIVLNYRVWADVFINTSSTAVVAFMFLPIYGFVVLALGYSVGFAIVWLLIRTIQKLMKNKQQLW